MTQSHSPFAEHESQSLETGRFQHFNALDRFRFRRDFVMVRFENRKKGVSQEHRPTAVQCRSQHFPSKLCRYE